MTSLIDGETDFLSVVSTHQESIQIKGSIILIFHSIKKSIDKNIKVSPLLLKDDRARLDIDIPLDNNDFPQEIEIKLEILGIGFKENYKRQESKIG